MWDSVFVYKELFCFPLRNFECDICKSKFNQNSYLKLHHQRVHEKIKDFGCKQCNLKFRCVKLFIYKPALEGNFGG